MKEKNSYAEVVNDCSAATLTLEFRLIDGVVDIEIHVEVFDDVEPLWKSFVVGLHGRFLFYCFNPLYCE